MKSIFNRRSIRKYKKKLVEKDKIYSLLKAAMQAPSAGNQQPWEFLVVQEKKNLIKLSEMSPYAQLIAEAPLAFVLFANEQRIKFPENWQQDMSAATENILLQAVELDLGAVWLGVAPLEDRMKYLKEIFDLPDNIKPFAVISIGYPDDSTKNKFIDRYDQSRIHFEKF